MIHNDTIFRTGIGIGNLALIGGLSRLLGVMNPKIRHLRCSTLTLRKEASSASHGTLTLKGKENWKSGGEHPFNRAACFKTHGLLEKIVSYSIPVYVQLVRIESQTTLEFGNCIASPLAPEIPFAL